MLQLKGFVFFFKGKFNVYCVCAPTEGKSLCQYWHSTNMTIGNIIINLGGMGVEAREMKYAHTSNSMT